MRSIVCFLSFLLLAGQALSLTIDIGGNLGSLSANNFLNVTDTYLLTNCQSQCNNANSLISNCTNDQCLCDTDTVSAITSCQQCMFGVLVANFATSADPRAGSQTALTAMLTPVKAYATACSDAGASVPASLVALSTPPDWDGPYEVVLSPGETVLSVAVATLLGGGALLLLSNM
ncbi:hypothetical protein JVU11DRAFT_8911 [Chiua virens]|nr:hypothetical protein JVU11DRAFT_8911 [Chiua virens]